MERRVALAQLREQDLGLALDAREDLREAAGLERGARARDVDEVERPGFCAQRLEGLGRAEGVVLCDLDVFPDTLAVSPVSCQVFICTRERDELTRCSLVSGRFPEPKRTLLHLPAV